MAEHYEKASMLCGSVQIHSWDWTPDICDVFKPVASMRSLRSEKQVSLSQSLTRTKWAENDYVVRAKKYWRDLSSDTQNAPSMDTFKLRLKKETALFRCEEIT